MQTGRFRPQIHRADIQIGVSTFLTSSEPDSTICIRLAKADLCRSHSPEPELYALQHFRTPDEAQHHVDGIAAQSRLRTFLAEVTAKYLRESRSV